MKTAYQRTKQNDYRDNPKKIIGVLSFILVTGTPTMLDLYDPSITRNASTNLHALTRMVQETGQQMVQKTSKTAIIQSASENLHVMTHKAQEMTDTTVKLLRPVPAKNAKAPSPEYYNAYP